jgi:hypothetical protein
MLDEYPSLPFPHTGLERPCGRSPLTRYGALIIVSLGIVPVRERAALLRVVCLTLEIQALHEDGTACDFSLSSMCSDLRSIWPPKASHVLFRLVLPSPSSRQSDAPWTSTATPMQTLFLERPLIVLPSALRMWSSGSSGHYVSSSHILSEREWRSPGKARSRRRASPSTMQGSQRSAGGRRRMPPRSYCLRIFDRNMAHCETGRCLESKSVPVADVNVLLQLRQRYLWIPLRSCPSRLKRADPHHGQAFGVYTSKRPASPSRDREGWSSAYAALRVFSASLEALALELSAYAMW